MKIVRQFKLAVVAAAVLITVAYAAPAQAAVISKAKAFFAPIFS